MQTVARFKTEQVNLRMNPELKRLAQRAASEDQCTLSNFIDRLLIKDLKARGLVDADGKPIKPAGKRK